MLKTFLALHLHDGSRKATGDIHATVNEKHQERETESHKSKKGVVIELRSILFIQFDMLCNLNSKIYESDQSDKGES